MTIAQAVAEEHFTFAKIISRRYCNKIGFDITEDLEAVGLVGLVKAANGYFSGGVPFKSWAAFKIRREISTHIKNQFRGKKGKSKRMATTIPIENLLDVVAVDGIEKKICDKDYIYKSLEQIPEKWREVIILYYIDEYNLEEVGEIKGYTKSNASRIKRQALKIMLKGDGL